MYKNVIFILWLLEAGCLRPYGERTRSQCNVPYITIHGMFSCYIDKAGRDHPERDEINEVVTLLDNTFTLRFLFYQLSIPCNIHTLTKYLPVYRPNFALSVSRFIIMVFVSPSC